MGMSALFVFTTKEKGDEQMKKRLFFVCALCALLAVALPALGERVELMDGRVSVELPEGVFCVRGSVTEEQAAMFGASAAEIEAAMEEDNLLLVGIANHPLGMISIFSIPLAASNDFAQSKLMDIIEVVNLTNFQNSSSNARILLHRQAPFIVYDQEAGKELIQMEKKTYMTVLDGYMLQISGTSIGEEWGAELDAMLADLVDNLILIGRPNYFRGAPVEDAKEIPVRLASGVEFTLPEGWRAPSTSRGIDGDLTESYNGMNSFSVQQIDGYGQMSASDKTKYKRSDFVMDSPLFSRERLIQTFDMLLEYVDLPETMDAAMQQVFAGLPIRDKLRFAFVEQNAQAGGEIIEINGVQYYYQIKRCQMTLDNDTFVCRDFPMAMEYYCTLVNGNFYLYISGSLYADAPSPEIEQIMRSITYAH